MLEAEQAAWGAVEALRPWGLTAIDRLVWRVGSPAHHEDGAHTVGFPYTVQAPMNAIWKYHADLLTETESLERVARGDLLITDPPYFKVWGEIREHLRWELAARSGLRVPEIEDIQSDHRRRVTEDRLRLMEQARSFSDGEDPDRQWFLEDPLPVPPGQLRHRRRGLGRYVVRRPSQSLHAAAPCLADRFRVRSDRRRRGRAVRTTARSWQRQKTRTLPRHGNDPRGYPWRLEFATDATAPLGPVVAARTGATVPRSVTSDRLRGQSSSLWLRPRDTSSGGLLRLDRSRLPAVMAY